MRWIPSEDCFTYTFNPRKDLLPVIQDDHIPTKREILKDCWTTGMAWDEPVNEELFGRWKRWTSFFSLLNTIRIPGCYIRTSSEENQNLQIHVFVDASEMAYCCVIYFRLEINGNVEVSLVASKTKVAPLKTLSIPKLELKAAVLGVRLMNTVISSHTLTFSRRYLWSDSTTVLAWIQSEHRRYPKFVAVRIGEILMTSEQQEWKWVPTKLNTADEGTKWKSEPNFRSDSPWFRGPNFLHEAANYWPEQRRFTTTLEEVCPSFVYTPAAPSLKVSSFSCWVELNRTVAHAIRFIRNLRRKRNSMPLELDVLQQEELNEAEQTLWKIVQAESFPSEISILKKLKGRQIHDTQSCQNQARSTKHGPSSTKMVCCVNAVE
ncbi:uncharacterized protein LOC129721047 isoform X3 [Wyeomyia smithii]|uniref:uncharacterized protein LOC129721047 isoform X3 n=1 Tax=Wyeomyia smithii TaxID=174621 RepID=UPI002467CA26|nr:uncharacterized protein LOC129721047 isoform X3 [Wyeomyia smithii]